MAGGRQDHVGAEKDAVPDIDVGIIHQRQVIVGVYILSKMNELPAEVGMKRRFHIAVFPQLGKHFKKKTVPLLLLGRPRPVIIVQKLLAANLLLHNLLIIRQIQKFLMHPFFHIHFTHILF